MALGVAGNFKDPRNRTNTTIVSVEIASGCNLTCPECLTGIRRTESREEKEKYARSENMAALLINYFPKDAVPVFIGLGEPTTEQETIIDFHHNRPDIKRSHIQTNGEYRLKPGLIKLIEEGIISVGVSYDNMHRQGGQKQYSKLPIQPEYVIGIATAIDGDDMPTKGLADHFKNLDRILVHPAINHENEYKVTWQQMKSAIRAYAEEYPAQAIYTDLSDYFEPANPAFYAQANAELVRQPGEDWKFHKELGFYAYAPASGAGVRFLINGTYTTKPEESAHASWKTIKDHTFPVEIMPTLV